MSVEEPDSSREEEQNDNNCTTISFGDIRLGQKLGQGDFGDVHLAKYKGSVVAVKLLQHGEISQDCLRQLQDKIKLLRQLDHPQIVKLIGVCVETSNQAIVKEYMLRSLYKVLHEEKEELDNKEKCQIIFQMTEGLTYLHTRKVPHCNLKSANILLDQFKGDVIAKISDFGLKMMKEGLTSRPVTPKKKESKYSAPEVLLGENLSQEAMCKADVYAMSVVTWEIICEEIPFRDVTINHLRRQAINRDLDLHIPESIPINKDLLALLKKCWSRQINSRPSSQSFLDRIKQLQDLLEEVPPGTFKCTAKKCVTCKEHIKESAVFSSTVTHDEFETIGHITCTTKRVIYLITCKESRCEKQYVGQTEMALKERWYRHRSSIECTKKQEQIETKQTALVHHFASEHSLSDMILQGIESCGDCTDDERCRKETGWMERLKTFTPDGLNMRKSLQT